MTDRTTQVLDRCLPDTNVPGLREL
jgi:hypothetical protein